MAGIRSGCMQFRSYPTIGIRLKGFRQLTAEIRPRLFGSDGIRLGIIDLGILVSFGEKTALRSAIRLYQSKTLGPHICNVLG